MTTSMEWLWTWGGKSFGYHRGDDLWTHDGRHVGRFHGNEIYGRDGRYLGEIRNKNRLIADTAKKHWRQVPFSAYASVVGYAPYADYAGYVMYVGFEDFPAPDAL